MKKITFAIATLLLTLGSYTHSFAEKITTIDGRYNEDPDGEWCCQEGSLCMIIVTPDLVQHIDNYNFEVVPDEGYDHLDIDLYKDGKNATRVQYNYLRGRIDANNVTWFSGINN